MNIEHKKLGIAEKSHSFMTSPNSELFMPEQIQNVKLNNLRQKRKQLQDKLKLVSNRISYRRKKQQDQLRRYIRTEQRSRVISQTKNFKRVNMMLKEQLNQKKIFEQRKKAKQVQDFRMTTNRRLHLIYQSVRDRKLSQSQKVRQLKKAEEDLMLASKTQALNITKQKHQGIQKMKQKQMTKRKCYWLQKRLTFQQNVIDQTTIYENQIQEYYKKIEELKKNQQQLREKQQHAIQVLKCAEQNYELLKQS